MKLLKVMDIDVHFFCFFTKDKKETDFYSKRDLSF